MIRRLYVYLVAFISLEIVLWGSIGLVRFFLSGANLGQETDSLAGALALLLVSAPVFGLHWWIAQRGAKRDISERSDRLRAIFLFGVLLATGIPAAQNAVAALDRLFLQAFGVNSFWAIFGGTQTLTDNLVAILINLLAGGYFYWVARGDGLALAQEDASRESPGQYSRAWIETRRLYRYLWLLYSLALVVAGIQQALLAVLTLWGTGDVEPWVHLANGLALLLLGAPLWWWLERLVRRSLKDPEERNSLLRLAVLYLVVFISLAVTLTAAGVALYYALLFVLGAAPEGAAFLAEIALPISLILPFGLLWLYELRLLRRSIASVAELDAANSETETRPAKASAGRSSWSGTAAGRRAGMQRLYGYFASLAGLTASFVGLAALLDFLVTLAIDPASWSQPGQKNSLAAGLAAMWVGLPLWILSWRPLQAEAALEGEAGDYARRSPVRRSYLFLVLFASVLGVMISGGAQLFALLQALFGSPAPDLLGELLPGLALLLLFGAVLLYHWRVLMKDNRLAQRSLSRRYAQFPVLILTPEADGQEMDHPEAFSRSLVDAIQRLVPDLPIEVHAYNQGVPDEALAAAQVVILPAELVARPSEALRLWLQAYQGQRLVIPTPAKGWHWVGVGSSGMPALARQAAQAVRRLAEGDASAQGNQPPWMIAAYLAVAFLGVIFLLALILAIVTLVIG